MGLEGHRRQAHLQRFAVLAPRLQFAEVVEDLRAVVEIEPEVPLSAAEREILRSAVTRPVYDHTLAMRPEFLDEVRRLARTSRAGRFLRVEVARSLCTAWPSRDPRTAARGLLNAAAGVGRLFVGLGGA